ncbi:MAG: cytochrome c maturation protein CcmE [Gammaproteobacteria bacterium]|nr:cytochrome c maturation protein CcmE [Gammaproteobacteria bacterium]
MNAKRRRRVVAVAIVVLGVGIATALALRAFQENLLFFFSPSEVLAGKAPSGREFRLGGLVERGSVVREADGLTVRFRVTDLGQTLNVHYRGILPDLFREGQGVVTRGRLNDAGAFVASEVLAKHDENYMPPEVAGSLKTAQSNTPRPAP